MAVRRSPRRSSASSSSTTITAASFTRQSHPCWRRPTHASNASSSTMPRRTRRARCWRTWRRAACPFASSGAPPTTARRRRRWTASRPRTAFMSSSSMPTTCCCRAASRRTCSPIYRCGCTSASPRATCCRCLETAPSRSWSSPPARISTAVSAAAKGSSATLCVRTAPSMALGRAGVGGKAGGAHPPRAAAAHVVGMVADLRQLLSP